MRVIWLHGMDGWVASRSAGSALTAFADLEQPDPDRVEHQAVGGSTPLKVRADRVDRGLNVGQ